MALFVKDLFWKKEFWVFLFIIGAVLLNWPVLTIVAGKYILSVPTTLVYVAAVWLLIIIIAYLFDRGSSD